MDKKVFITFSPSMTQKIDDWGFKVKCFAPKVGRITQHRCKKSKKFQREKKFFCSTNLFSNLPVKNHYRLYGRMQFSSQCSFVLRQTIKNYDGYLKCSSIGLHQPLDGITNPKYKLKCCLTTHFFSSKRRRHQLLTGKGAAIQRSVYS